MTKRNNIIYWIATLLLALGMASSGFFQMIKLEYLVEKIGEWGYPAYLLTLLGTWKILGVIAILVPKFPLVKEWAYAGYFFLMTGALFTHFSIGDPATAFLGPALLLILTLVSWYFRPEDRKIQQLP
jgi:DoxX-like family